MYFQTRTDGLYGGSGRRRGAVPPRQQPRSEGRLCASAGLIENSRSLESHLYEFGLKKIKQILSGVRTAQLLSVEVELSFVLTTIWIKLRAKTSVSLQAPLSQSVIIEIIRKSLALL
jgi:hypothetical protein